MTGSWWRGAGLVLGGTALLAGCAGTGHRLPPPPRATEAQIDKERQHLQHAFFTDPCMEKLRKAAPELKPGEAQQGGKTIYAVEYPPNTQQRDGLAYQLHVKELGRLGYLYIGDGTAGSYQVHGPLPLWTCLNAQLF